jgi:hypothetical protein
MTATSHTGWLLFTLLSCSVLEACGEEGKTLDPNVCPPQPLYHYDDDGKTLVGPDGKPLSERALNTITAAESAGCITKAGFATTDTVGAGAKTGAGGAGIVDAGSGGVAESGD